MKTTLTLLPRWAVLTLACLGQPHQASAAEDSTVTISLLPQSEVAAEIVVLRDIATITGGSLRQREQLGALDIGRWTAGTDSFQLTRSQVDLRLRLAGIDAKWMVRGPAVVTAQRAAVGTLESRVVDTIQSAYAAALRIEEEDVVVRLSYPLPARLRQEYPRRAFELEPELGTPPRWGRLSVRLRATHEGQLTHVFPVQVDVRQLQPVAVLQHPVQAGQPIDDNQVVWERQAVTRPDDLLPEAELAGQVAATTLPTGTWLQRRHVRRPTVQQAPEVRARDQIRVVAERGALTVALSGGIALQSGRVGDSIRVRNPNSGQILTARVVSANEVRVAY